MIVALGVDSGGCKHVLGLREGSSENSQVVTDLLNDLVERGVGPDRLRLFVIDGSKALRRAINAVYGSKNPVHCDGSGSPVSRPSFPVGLPNRHGPVLLL